MKESSKNWFPPPDLPQSKTTSRPIDQKCQQMTSNGRGLVQTHEFSAVHGASYDDDVMDYLNHAHDFQCDHCDCEPMDMEIDHSFSCEVSSQMAS